jgi:hypothetical protein
MDIIRFLDEERSEEVWKNDPQASRIEGLQVAIDEITRLRAALAVFADDASWSLNGVCDPNSGNFRGQEIAEKALNPG